VDRLGRGGGAEPEEHRCALPLRLRRSPHCSRSPLTCASSAAPAGFFVFGVSISASGLVVLFFKPAAAVHGAVPGRVSDEDAAALGMAPVKGAAGADVALETGLLAPSVGGVN